MQSFFVKFPAFQEVEEALASNAPKVAIQSLSTLDKHSRYSNANVSRYYAAGLGYLAKKTQPFMKTQQQWGDFILAQKEGVRLLYALLARRLSRLANDHHFDELHAIYYRQYIALATSLPPLNQRLSEELLEHYKKESAKAVTLVAKYEYLDKALEQCRILEKVFEVDQSETDVDLMHKAAVCLVESHMFEQAADIYKDNIVFLQQRTLKTSHFNTATLRQLPQLIKSYHQTMRTLAKESAPLLDKKLVEIFVAQETCKNTVSVATSLAEAYLEDNQVDLAYAITSHTLLRPLPERHQYILLKIQLQIAPKILGVDGLILTKDTATRLLTFSFLDPKERGHYWLSLLSAHIKLGDRAGLQWDLFSALTDKDAVIDHSKLNHLLNDGYNFASEGAPERTKVLDWARKSISAEPIDSFSLIDALVACLSTSAALPENKRHELLVFTTMLFQGIGHYLLVYISATPFEKHGYNATWQTLLLAMKNCGTLTPPQLGKLIYEAQRTIKSDSPSSGTTASILSPGALYEALPHIGEGASTPSM